MEEIKNLKRARIEMVYRGKKLYTEIKMLENEEN